MTEDDLNPRIRSVATAVPAYSVNQASAKEFATAIFAGRGKDLARLLPVFDHTLIERRYLSQPPEWYGQRHTFPETNALYVTRATDLAVEAATTAIEKAGLSPADIEMVVFVSTTGLATPSIDAKLIERLGLRRQTSRLPVWGLGCAGGVAGLARAAELARARPGRRVLLVAVELCSLTFQYQDTSKANLIAVSLFGDGAAAVIIQAGGSGPAILNSYSTLFPNSEDIMGWEVVETGLKVRFARSIPTLIEQHLPALWAEAAAAWGQTKPAWPHFVAHPGGAKVLAAYRDSLGLTPAQLAPAYDVLRNYGNMSSVSVLFVLERFLATVPPSQAYGVMLALGPGFSAEQLLFQW